MARKKRLNTAAVLGAESVIAPAIPDELVQGFRTAAYVRLSMEDSGKLDGYSLQNQKDLLMSFINDHSDLHLYKMYVDNGYTGTQFERPAFDEMMQDMKSGLINCIVVKDLSRLGRNYLEAGNYLEQIFPFFKVRFISVTDGYDSISPDFTDEALIIPLKNIINEGYAKDISVKVSSAIATRKRQGKFMGKVPLYGYLKDPDDKNHLVIDPEASRIVQRVFQMKLEGVSLGLIAKQMNEEGVPCPSKYFVLKGLSKETKYLNSFWDRNTAKRMLTNRMYLGCIVYGKSVRSFAKGIKEHTVPEENWKIVEGTHEPLVTEEAFGMQDLIRKKQRRIAKVEQMSCGIYEDYQEGILNETEYLTLRKTYAEEVLSLTKEIEGLLQEQAQYDENYRAVGSLSELAHQYSDFTELTREIIETFIAEIRVHTGGRLKITFRFEDEFEKLQQIAEMRKGA